jgi:hypothetical protein
MGARKELVLESRLLSHKVTPEGVVRLFATTWIETALLALAHRHRIGAFGIG